jgi:hypothetical protein
MYNRNMSLSRYHRLSGDEMREQMMNMTINEILDRRLVSREWRDIIDEDSFWCRLIKRDYDEDVTTNCKIQYRKMTNKYYNVARRFSEIKGEFEKTLKKCKMPLIKKSVDNSVDDNIKLLENYEDGIVYHISDWADKNDTRQDVHGYIGDYDYYSTIIDNLLGFNVSHDFYEEYETEFETFCWDLINGSKKMRTLANDLDDIFIEAAKLAVNIPNWPKE